MNRFSEFSAEERNWLKRALLRLAEDTVKHGCAEHAPMALNVLNLAKECMELDAPKEPRERPRLDIK